MKWLSIIFVTVVLFSCKMETQHIDTQKLSLNTSLDVKNLYIKSEDTIYAFGGNLWNGGFLERSIDGGANWDTLLTHWKVILSMEVNSKNDIVVGSHYGGIHISNDNGASFIYHERQDINAVNDMTLINDSIVLIAGGESFYTGGSTLLNINNLAYQTTDLEQSLACQYFFDAQNGVVGAYGTIYTTNNGGQTLNATNATGDYFKDIAFNDNGKGIAIGYQGKIMQSNNYGASWKKIGRKGSFFTTKGNLESVDIFGNTVIVCGQNGAFFLSNDFGENWVKLDFEYSNSDLFRVILTSSTEGYLCGSDGLLLKLFL